MAKQRTSKEDPKTRYLRLTEQEKNLRVEIVHLRENLLFSEDQFFYRVFHFFSFFLRDLKNAFIRQTPAAPAAQKKETMQEKMDALTFSISVLQGYRDKLYLISRSPFILFVWLVKGVRSVVLFIPNRIEKDLIAKELVVGKSEKMNTDIINFGVIPYHFRRLRQQHLAEELAKRGERVFYVENRFIQQGKNKALYEIRKETNNVFVVRLSCTRDIAIYHQQPTNQEIKSIVRSLHAFMKEAKIKRPAAKIDHPFWTYLLPHLKMPVIYDCMDDYEGFDITGKHILKLEKELVKKSDLTVVCSNILLQKIKKLKPRKTVLIRNACEYGHFSGASVKKDTCSAGLCWVHQPVIGFFGAIGEWINAGLIEKTALAYPAASIVMIGEVQNSAVLSVGERLPNVFLLGEKPYAKLPEYLQTFDICIIPFSVNEHTTLIDPVKLYEYFAAGKAVVTTAIREIAKYKPLMYYSATEEEFIANIRKALKEKAKTLTIRRQETARKNTWTVRAAVLHREIQRLSGEVYNKG